MKSIEIGDIVISVQGRDKGTYYIVTNVLKDNYYVLVNGNNKKFSCPKHKIKKHIKYAGRNLDNIKTKIQNDVKVFDSEVYSAIKKFKQDLTN